MESIVVPMILFDAGCGTGVIGGVIRVSPDCSSQFPVLSGIQPRFGLAGKKRLYHRGHRGAQGRHREVPGKKNAGLKAATLISVSNPVSQVLW